MLIIYTEVSGRPSWSSRYFFVSGPGANIKGCFEHRYVIVKSYL